MAPGLYIQLLEPKFLPIWFFCLRFPGGGSKTLGGGQDFKNFIQFFKHCNTKCFLGGAGRGGVTPLHPCSYTTVQSACYESIWKTDFNEKLAPFISMVYIFLDIPSKTSHKISLICFIKPFKLPINYLLRHFAMLMFLQECQMSSDQRLTDSLWSLAGQLMSHRL